MHDEDFDSLASERWIDARCDEFQRALSNGQSPRIESFLVGVTQLDCQRLLKELIGLDVDFRFAQNEQPVVSDYAQRFPSLSAEQIESIFESSEVNCFRSTASFSEGKNESDQLKPIGDHKLIGRKLHIYQCVSLLGAGAMGQVYLALHDDLQRHCALKILAPKHGVYDKEYIAQFQQEGQAAAALIHPNIVGLHAIGCIADTHFLEMEYVPGISLQQLINNEGPLPTVRALRLATMVADGLAAAHRAGIIHRDVKPANVIVTPEGIAKVGDFGLAKKLMSDDEDVASKDFCGTPNYMAPELFHGRDASPASDVYALGLCLFQMLIGKLPWQETSLTHLAWYGRTETIPNVRDLRPELSTAIADCVELLTASSLSDRPANAVAAARLLHAVMGSERDIESLLIEAFANDTTITWNREGERYSLTRLLPGNRRQIVFVETTEHATLERILLIYSTCCDADPSYYEQALRQNWIVMHGSLAIRDMDGKPMFVVINAYPRSTVAPEEIRRSVIDIATQADEVERHLTGTDRY